MKNILHLNDQMVCLTTDTWTSEQQLSYMVVTMHFIDHNWKLHKRILSFFPITCHKGVPIGNGVEACMVDWGIKKVLTMTVDNATNNDTAIAHLRKKFKNKYAFVMDGEHFQVRCTTHILNLIVKDGMKEEQGSVDKIRAVVKYIRSSPQRGELFRICCEKDGNPHRHILVLDVPTRWNYTYLMLETALKFKNSIERLEDIDVCYSTELGDKAPGPVDWKNAETFCKFLKTFYEVTNRLSGSSYVTAHSYFHDVMTIQTTITQWTKSKDSILRSMAERMELKFMKYWGSTEKITMMLLVAVVLDPRCKLQYVLFCYKRVCRQLTTDEVGLKLRGTLTKLYSFYEGVCSDGRNDNSTGTQVHLEEELDNDLVMDIANIFEIEKNKGVVSKSELDIYVEEESLKNVHGVNFDILSWWKVNSSRFPILSLIARDVLAIPVTSVAFESAFNTSGRILSSYRSKLSPKTVEGLIYAQDWLRTSPISINDEAIFVEASEIESSISEDPEILSAFTSGFCHG